MRVMLVAGEASGDTYGALLARTLRELAGPVEFFGMGGAAMAAAGVELLYNPTRRAPVGVVESLASAPVFRRVLHRLVEAAEERQPAAVVYIDFPGFNLRLAEHVKALGLPSVYFCPPAVWAWGAGRATRVARLVTRVASIFPFEAELYRQAGADVTFVGHPLLDRLGEIPDRAAARSELGLEGNPVVALLPGSREQEVRALLPAMLEAARRVEAAMPDAAFVLPVAPALTDGPLEGWMRERLGRGPRRMTVLAGQAQQALAAADAALVASGTATLEAALLETPQVIVYRTAGSTFLLGKLLVKIPYIGLPNIVAGRRICPELLQGDATAEKMAAALERLLTDPGEVAAMRAGFRVVRQHLGKPGAIRRTGRLVLEVAAPLAEGAGAWT